MEKNLITHFFEDVETTKEYDGYFYKVTDAITIVLLGNILRSEKYQLDSSVGIQW